MQLEELNLSYFNKGTLSFLLNNQDDLDLFMNEYWTGEDEDQYEAIFEFRMFKQSKNYLSLPTFLKLYSEDAIKALQSLFQHPVSESEYEIFVDCMGKRQMDISDVYNKHNKHPEYLLLRIVL